MEEEEEEELDTVRFLIRFAINSGATYTVGKVK